MNITQAIGLLSAAAAPFGASETAHAFDGNVSGGRLISIEGQPRAVKTRDVALIQQMHDDMRSLSQRSVGMDSLNTDTSFLTPTDANNDRKKTLCRTLENNLSRAVDRVLSTSPSKIEFENPQEERADRNRIRREVTALDISIKDTLATLEEIKQDTLMADARELSSIRTALHEIFRDRVIFLNGIP